MCYGKVESFSSNTVKDILAQKNTMVKHVAAAGAAFLQLEMEL